MGGPARVKLLNKLGARCCGKAHVMKTRHQAWSAKPRVPSSESSGYGPRVECRFSEICRSQPQLLFRTIIGPVSGVSKDVVATPMRLNQWMTGSSRPSIRSSPCAAFRMRHRSGSAPSPSQFPVFLSQGLQSGEAGSQPEAGDIALCSCDDHTAASEVSSEESDSRLT